MNINEFIVQTLESLGVEHVFGGSGQVNASLMIALKNSKIKTHIVKNEQAASFMACGYSMFSDKLGVCFATGGPGAINLLSGMGVAQWRICAGYIGSPQRRGSVRFPAGVGDHRI